MPINANDYIVSSVRYKGSDEDIPISLRRISNLDDATNDQIDNSYIVLADSENHKNYKAKLGHILRNVKKYSENYTKIKVEELRQEILRKLNSLNEQILLLKEKIDEIPSLSEIEALINDNIQEVITLLDSKANIDDIDTLRDNLTVLQQSLHRIAISGNYNDLENKPDIANNAELNNKFDTIALAINDLDTRLVDIIDELTVNTNISLQNSRIDNLLARIEYIENYGGGGGQNQDLDPTPGPVNPTEQITYKFWLISENELNTYFNGETFTESFNNKFVASKVNGCPFTNEGYSALYLIKRIFEYDSSITQIDSFLYLVIPKKYGTIIESNNTIKINGKILSSGVFKIYGNSYYKQNVNIENVNYHIIRISNEASIGDGIELTLI